jgi:hypothetical protein
MSPTPSAQTPGWTAVRYSRLWLAAIVVGPVLCFFVVVLLHVTAQTVAVHDPRFQVLGYKISTGTEHVMYDGNQTLCRVNQWLKRTTGLDVLRRGEVRVSSPRQTYGFLLRYRGQIDPNELRNLKAFLTAPDGFSKELQGGASSASPRTYLRCYLLTNASSNPGPYRLVLRLPSTDKPVATCEIGQLR